jgi:hypothetical protein
MIQKRDQGIEKMTDIKQGNRFPVITELKPGEGFEGLFEGADSSRKCYEGIGKTVHAFLTFMHARYNLQPYTVEGWNTLMYCFRDDSGYRSRNGEGSSGNSPHQAKTAASVDQLKSTLPDCLPKGKSPLSIVRFGAAA